MTEPLRDIVLEANARHGLFPRGTRAVVAVSGGADSTALLHVLASLRDDLDIDLHAAHLDHGLRGEEGQADAVWVASFARTLDVPITVGWRDVPEAARLGGGTIEEAARRVRRRFLRDTATRVGASVIALGHTRDDQAETVLLNILRGAGLDGLRGMAPLHHGLVRPLLGASRAATEAYCREHAIAYRTDASNQDLAYRRNRVRAELLPNLETYYNPSVRDALIRLSNMAGADAAVLDSLARDMVDGAAVELPGGAWRVASQSIVAQPLGLRRRMLRHLFARVVPGLVDVHFDAVDAALASASGAARPMSWSVPGGSARIEAGPDAIVVSIVQAPRTPLPILVALTVPGEALVPEWGIAVRAEVLPEPVDLTPIRGDSVQAPLRAIEGELCVRNRRPGDRMGPLGAGGSRKIQDILTDHKVPAQARDGVPIVADALGPIWVVGHALDERASLVEPTGPIARLTILRGVQR